jgi:nitrite reductase/ring-hydroxylating ferredoxin subunit
MRDHRAAARNGWARGLHGRRVMVIRAVIGQNRILPPSPAVLELRVPGVAALAHGEARTFHFRRDGIAHEAFVLRLGEGFFAYLNRCPHWHVDLDLGDGRFYDDALDRIYCKNHGALFQPDTGECDSGPCFGDSLERYPVRLDGADAIVAVPDAEK